MRRGDPGGNARLNLIATLRAAAPWQGCGGRDAMRPADARVHVRREDFRVTRFKQRSETTALFVVDASGSAALHRLAETKGAVELLLADCYVRRDSVAVIAFRGRGAELLLPPTRSLVRASAAWPNCRAGGTPLAAGIDAAALLAETIRRRGCTPLIVLLTDGRANIAPRWHAGPSPRRRRCPGRGVAAASGWASAPCCSTLLRKLQDPARAAGRLHGRAIPAASACRCAPPVARRARRGSRGPGQRSSRAGDPR